VASRRRPKENAPFGVEGFVRLRPDQIFMVDEFTIPAFRRRGITRRMAIAMAPAVFAQG
jgi:hypothetical protein